MRVSWGCRGLFQVSALRVTELLKNEGSQPGQPRRHHNLVPLLSTQARRPPTVPPSPAEQLGRRRRRVCAGRGRGDARREGWRSLGMARMVGCPWRPAGVGAQFIRPSSSIHLSRSFVSAYEEANIMKPLRSRSVRRVDCHHPQHNSSIARKKVIASSSLLRCELGVKLAMNELRSTMSPATDRQPNAGASSSSMSWMSPLTSASEIRACNNFSSSNWFPTT